MHAYCLGEKVKDLNSKFDFATFDRVRYMRNAVNYYGTKIPFEQGLEVLQSMHVLYVWLVQVAKID